MDDTALQESMEEPYEQKQRRMNKHILYTLHVGHMTPGENEITIYNHRETALMWWQHEVSEAHKYYGRVSEVYSHWQSNEDIDKDWLDEVGPQTIAQYYAEHKDGSYLVRLEAHLIHNK